MKPYILGKYPQASTGLFMQNSDIHFLIKNLEQLKKKFGVKPEINEEKKQEINETPIIKEKTPQNISKKEEQNNNNNNILKEKIKIDKEEDIKKLKEKIGDKIVDFLDDFIEENKLKRASSMISLRRCSQTLSSFTTCDDSMCGGETGHKKSKINLNQLLIIDNSEINQKSKNPKDMAQRSLNLYQSMLDKKKESKENKNEIIILNKPRVGFKKDQTMSLFMGMSPKFNVNENEIEKYTIEYSDKDKNIIKNISFDLLFKKIIFENFLDKYHELIYHFCQQCFCFVNKEILFKKLFHCYKIYMNKKIPLEKMKNLIVFINILILEMFEYYEKIDLKEMQIEPLKKFYNDLMIYLLTNNKEEESKKEKQSNDNNNIINDILQGKKVSRFNSITKDEQYIFNENNDIIIDRKNLVNINLNYDEKNINIFIFKNKNNISNNKEINNKNDAKINSKDSSKDISKEINIEFPEFYKISKTLKRKLNISINNNISTKYLKNVEEEIKEENDEDDLYSDNDENDEENKIQNKEKEVQKKTLSFGEKNLKEEDLINIDSDDEDIENKNGSEIINNILNKVFTNEDKIVSIKDEMINDINYMLKIVNVKDKENISQKNLVEMKSKISFYTLVKIPKKKESSNKLDKYIQFSKGRTPSATEFSFKSNNSISNSKNNYFCITDWPTEEIGNKLTQVTVSLLNKIHRRELYKALFLKKEKEITCPNVCGSINGFNKLTSFIIEDVLSYNTPKARARVYEKWVQVCDYCRSIKNYNDCIAIYSALNNYIITGLNLTLKEIKYKTKSTFEQISLFCSCDANYKNIRNDMHLCEDREITFIPYLGMLLRDINFIEESAKYINQKGCINMDKIEKINALIEKYFKYKTNEEISKTYDIKKCSKELSFFDKLEIIKEEELENIASNIEPEYKYDKTEIKRLTLIDKQYFGRIMKKRGTITAPQRASLEKKFNYF